MYIWTFDYQIFFLCLYNPFQSHCWFLTNNIFSPQVFSTKTQSIYFYIDIKHFPEAFYTQRSQKTESHLENLVLKEVNCIRDVITDT